MAKHECPVPCPTCYRIVDLHDMVEVADGQLVCDDCVCIECDGNGECQTCYGEKPCCECGRPCLDCKGTGHCDFCEGAGWRVFLEDDDSDE